MFSYSNFLIPIGMSIVISLMSALYSPDVIAIFQALKQAGALRSELVIL